MHAKEFIKATEDAGKGIAASLKKSIKR